MLDPADRPSRSFQIDGHEAARTVALNQPGELLAGLGSQCGEFLLRLDERSVHAEDDVAGLYARLRRPPGSGLDHQALREIAFAALGVGQRMHSKTEPIRCA